MSSLSRQRPVMQRLAAWLGLWAMLVPLLTGLVHQPPQTDVGAAPVVAMSSIPISGMAHCPDMAGMAMATAAAPVKTPVKHPAKKPACPICQSLHLLQGGLLPPTLPVLVLAVLTFLGLFAPAGVAFLRQMAAFPQARPRAPPWIVQP